MTQQREAIEDVLHASPFNPAGDLREQRQLFDKMVAAAPVSPDVVTPAGRLDVPVVRVDIPGTTTTDGVIVFFHGGFFAIGSAPVGLAADLARKARMQVVTSDYRLVPEHPPPPRRTTP